MGHPIGGFHLNSAAGFLARRCSKTLKKRIVGNAAWTHKWFVRLIVRHIRAPKPRCDTYFPLFLLQKFRVVAEVYRSAICPLDKNGTINCIESSAINVGPNNQSVVWQGKAKITKSHPAVNHVSGFHKDGG